MRCAQFHGGLGRPPRGCLASPLPIGSDFIAYVTKTVASDGEVDVFEAGYEAAITAQHLAESQEVA